MLVEISCSRSLSQNTSEAPPLPVTVLSCCLPSVCSSSGSGSGEPSPAPWIQIPSNSDFLLASQFKKDPCLTLPRYCFYLTEGTRDVTSNSGTNQSSLRQLVRILERLGYRSSLRPGILLSICLPVLLEGGTWTRWLQDLQLEDSEHHL